jgi:fermentation-respiration switch protein FrsA (DUF1100 family)
VDTNNESSSDPNPESRSPKPVSKSIKRWAWKLARIVVIAYVGLGLVLALLQTQLIFPGAATQGAPDATSIRGARCRAGDAENARGERVVALFGRALDATGQPHPDARSRPTLIYFYGNAMCIAAAVEGGEFYEFRRRGFNVMVPDYLGYGMSSGKPSEAGVYATADACFDHLKQRGDAGNRRRKIVPLGLSLGGGAAFYLAATRSEIPCVATIAAFTSVDAMARRLFPFLPVGMMLKHHFDNESNCRKIRQARLPRPRHARRHRPLRDVAKTRRRRAAGGAKVIKYDVPDGDHNDIYDIGGTPCSTRSREFVNAHAANARGAGAG